MAEFKASKFKTIDSVEVITFDEPATIVEPTSGGDFAQLINAQNDVWYGRAYATANSTPAEYSNVNASPTYQNNASHTEVQIAGMGYQKYEIIHRLRIADHGQLAVGDKIRVELVFSVAGGADGQDAQIEVRNTATEALVPISNIQGMAFNNAASNQDFHCIFEFELTATEVDIVLSGTFNNTTTFTPTSGDPWYTNNITTSGWHISWSQRHVDVVQNSSDTEFWTKERYRYGFNGMERDDEMKGFGNSYTAAFWEYDARLGRRWNVDPLAHKFPHQSPYLAMDGNPMLMKDPKGMSASKYGDEVGNNSGAVKDLNDATIYTSNYYRDALFAPIYTGGFIVPDILGIEYDRQYEPWETGCFLTMSLTDGDPVPKSTTGSNKKSQGVSEQRDGANWAKATLGFIAADIAIPEPTDAAWPKWAGYGIAGSAAAVYLHYVGKENANYPGPWSYTYQHPSQNPIHNPPNGFDPKETPPGLGTAAKWLIGGRLVYEMYDEYKQRMNQIGVQPYVVPRDNTIVVQPQTVQYSPR